MALDDYAAIEIWNDKFRIITSKSFAKAHKVYKEGKKILYNKIEKNKFYPLEFLLKK